MKPLLRAMNRLHGAMFGRRQDSDLAEELQMHIEMQTEDNIRAGMSPARREDRPC